MLPLESGNHSIPLQRGLALIPVLAVAFAACSGSEPDVGQVAAEVNGERITYADLARYEVSRIQDLRSSAGSLDARQELLQRMGLLRELVDQRVLLQRADAQGLAVADKDVDAAIERHRLAYGTSEDFQEFLDGAGIELRDFRDELRRQLTVEKLLNREIASKVRVGETEMREYYDNHLAAFAVPEQQLHLAQILVTDTQVAPVPNLRNDDATDLESARRKIQRIREELDSGADFEQLALHYSEDPVFAANGGDMGFISQSSLEKTDVRLRRALVALEPGDVSPVVQTDGEFRILHLIAIEPAGRREFDDPGVQDSIREVLVNRKRQLLRSAMYEVERNRSRIRNYLAERIADGHGIGD